MLSEFYRVTPTDILVVIKSQLDNMRIIDPYRVKIFMVNVEQKIRIFTPE